jgi:dihydroneopterin aldolase
MSDSIQLRGLRVMAIVGVLPEEREREQPLEADLDIEVDLSAAGVSDALSDSVDYGSVTDAVVGCLVGSRAFLLERMATQVTAAVLELDSRIESVGVTLRKLKPPVPHDLETSAVSITRRAGSEPD